ncbi:MAG: short-chain dehydrogenase/reductase [Actinomycetia bacterium]|nr:short-chain dehydrogenase/reductase [Actinomycetes bacterium]
MLDAKATNGTYIVTGGSSGLGAEVVLALARVGAPVTVLDRVAPKAEIDFELVDLADSRAAEAAVRRVVDRSHAIDGVVTCAGIDACGALVDVPGDEWDRVVAVNLLGTAAVIRAALPAVSESRGRVVTVASTLGLRAVGDATAYCASKFGIVGFTRALAKETAGRIGVTLLIPGGMRTPFFDGRDPQYQPGPDANLNPPERVADAILFALQSPVGTEVRELVVCADTEDSWP